MHFTTSTFASALVLAGSCLVHAQEAQPTPEAQPTQETQTAVHVVSVGNAKGDKIFNPAQIDAKPGDKIQFQFYPNNHSVVQSTFDQPCQPLANNMPGATGFFSGYMPVSLNDTMMPAFTVDVKDEKPIWFYCSQAKHCEAGMVGVVNPPKANQSRTLESFKSLAKLAPENIAPSPATPTDPGLSLSNSTASMTTSVSSTESSAPTPSSGFGSFDSNSTTPDIVPTPPAQTSPQAATGTSGAGSLLRKESYAGVIAMALAIVLVL